MDSSRSGAESVFNLWVHLNRTMAHSNMSTNRLEEVVYTNVFR